VKKGRGAVPESVAATAIGDWPDAVLLERFALDRDARAFAVLVQRFGSLVLGVCRRVLRHEQDAEDAFQATFLVLARKAGSIHKRESIGSWLYGVAYRIASKARSRNVRRQARQERLTDIPDDAPQAPLASDLRELLDGEVNQLPVKYRRPFVLYYVEGKTKEQVAQELKCPLGTVVSRLGRARERLRTRLLRRGVTTTATVLATALTEQFASAALPSALAEATSQAALHFVGAGPATAAATSAKAAALARGYTKGLLRKRLEKLAAALVALGAIVLVILLLLQTKPGPTTPVQKDELDGTWKIDQFTINGQGLPAPDLRMTFAGGRWSLSSEQGEALSAVYRRDPTKEPKEVDLVMQRGQLWPGIYAIEGDTLRLCYNTGDNIRPTSFDTRPTSSTGPDTKLLSYVLHREAGGP
jgi:RNA polymerase sigma factor (sigma-70 family)